MGQGPSTVSRVRSPLVPPPSAKLSTTRTPLGSACRIATPLAALAAGTAKLPVDWRSATEAIFLAERESVVAGILRCVESMGSPLLDPARYAYVSSVYVRPEVRRRGVLRALLRAADAWSADRGLDQMRLHNVAGSPSAEGAWTALGFHVVEQVRLRRMHPEQR